MNERENAETNVFINFSNHHSGNWSEDQKNVIFDQYNAQIVDIAFPQVITLLKKKGIRTMYSCSERKTIEKKTDSGTIKTSEFCFVRFREY